MKRNDQMKTTPLNLETVSQKELETLVNAQHLVRRYGACWGMAPKEYWTLTVKAEALYHLV
jgi:hypothetical protein